jgi:hypothetical protein
MEATGRTMKDATRIRRQASYSGEALLDATLGVILESEATRSTRAGSSGRKYLVHPRPI